MVKLCGPNNLHFCEDVTISDKKGNKVKVNMLIDSGADLASVKHKALGKLDLKKGDKWDIEVFGGKKVTTQELKGSTIEFGDGCKTEITLDETPDKSISFSNGILGIIALKSAGATIDFKNMKVKC